MHPAQPCMQTVRLDTEEPYNALTDLKNSHPLGAGGPGELSLDLRTASGWTRRPVLSGTLLVVNLGFLPAHIVPGDYALRTQ